MQILIGRVLGYNEKIVGEIEKMPIVELSELVKVLDDLSKAGLLSARYHEGHAYYQAQIL